MSYFLNICATAPARPYFSFAPWHKCHRSTAPLNFSATVNLSQIFCLMPLLLHLLSPFSCLLSHMSPVSHLPSHVSCLTILVCCLLSIDYCLLSLVSCLLSPVSCLEWDSWLMSSVSFLQSHSCLTSPVSHISFLVPRTVPNYATVNCFKLKLSFLISVKLSDRFSLILIIGEPHFLFSLIYQL